MELTSNGIGINVIELVQGDVQYLHHGLVPSPRESANDGSRNRCISISPLLSKVESDVCAVTTPNDPHRPAWALLLRMEIALFAGFVFVHPVLK